MNIRIALLSAAAGALLTAAPAQSADWPRWRGPDLNGISKETAWSPKALNGEPKILWRAKIGMGFSSFAVADGRVYTTGNAADTDTLFCFDAETGKELWKHSYPEPLDPKYYEGGTSATPSVDGDTVYQMARKGQAIALDAQTGKVKWAKNVAKEVGAEVPTWGFAASPFVHGDLLVLNVGKHGTALEKKTGKLVWTTGREASGYGTPVPCDVAGKKGLAIFAAKEIVGVDSLTGKVQWSHPWKTEYDVNAADPIFDGGKVFLSSGYGTGGGLIDLANGRPKEVWANKNMHNQFNSCVLIGGHLYGITGQDGKSGDSGLACVELATGKLKWLEKSLMLGAVSAAGDRLIVMGEKGELVIAEANPAKFTALSRGQVLGGKCWSVPVLANGRILVRNAKGDVACVDVRN